MFSKINLLYYNKHIPTVLGGIPSSTYGLLELTSLRDKHYWYNVHNLFSIGLIDFRHWLYEDDIFKAYLEKIKRTQLKYLIFCEEPFGFETPSIAWKQYKDKVLERTEQFYSTVKTQDRTIISPRIHYIKDQDNYESHIDYFAHTRSFFDVYALDLCYDLNEITFARITSLLHEVLNTLNKPVWVTHWALPSCDHVLETTTTDWKKVSQKEASQKMVAMYTAIEHMTKNNCTWFYTGVDKDLYHLHKRPGSNEWWNYSYKTLENKEKWQFYHFCGMFDYTFLLKQTVFDELKKLCSLT